MFGFQTSSNPNLAVYLEDLSCLMGKPTICIGKNKGADQLRGNRKADQHLCFRYTDSTRPLLFKSEISRDVLLSIGKTLYLVYSDKILLSPSRYWIFFMFYMKMNYVHNH